MARPRQEFYRGRFMIGIYSLLHEGETLLNLCDTVQDFAKLMKIREDNARMILQNAFSGKSRYIVYANKIRTVAFISIL